MTLLEKVKSRGHWRVVIRPGRFVERRIPRISSLYPIIQKTAVQLRGWDFPHVDTHTKPHIDVDWLGQESEWQEFLEIWRFYQSGQFVDIAGIWEDWRDKSDPTWKSGVLLGIGDTLFRFTEIYEFAARLALTEVGNELMYIEVTINGLAGRKLWDDSHDSGRVYKQYEASLQELPFKQELPRDELVTQPRELALRPAIELFARFGWTADAAALRDIQKKLRTR